MKSKMHLISIATLAIASTCHGQVRKIADVDRHMINADDTRSLRLGPLARGKRDGFQSQVQDRAEHKGGRGP